MEYAPTNSTLFVSMDVSFIHDTPHVIKRSLRMSNVLILLHYHHNSIQMEVIGPCHFLR